MDRLAIVNIHVDGFDIEQQLVYSADREQKEIMSIIRREGRKKYGFWVGFLGDTKIMQLIVEAENKHFKRVPHDAEPQDWAEFKAWAMNRGYLAIEELPETPEKPSDVA